MNKRGISAVVATVLIILITIAAISIIWTALIPMINEERLDIDNVKVRLEILTLEGYTAYDSITNLMTVQIKRGSDNEEVDQLKIIVEFDDGNTHSSIAVSPSQNQVKTYKYDLSEWLPAKPITVKIAPFFTDGNSIKEGSITSEAQIPSGKIVDSSGALNLDDGIGGFGFPPTVTGLLVSHYTFEVNAQDTVGDYDGILHNGTSIVTDPVRVKVAKFDGINDYIQMPSSEKLNNNYTLSIWVKFNGSNSQQEIIDSRMGENHFLVRRTSGGIVQFSDWTGGGIGGVIYSNGALSVGEWTHIVLVKDNNVLKMYIDKILQTDTNTTSGSLTYTNTAIDLGAASGSSGGSSQYNGSLDDFMVYNKSLNQSEVNALYNSQYIAPSCTNGQTQSCSNQAGVCSGSFETCAGNSWPGCGASEYGAGYEATETSCFDNIDNDCNGLKDYQDFASCSFGTGLVAYWKGEGNLNDELGTYSSGNLAGAATATATGVNSSKQAFSTNGVSGTYINLTESNPFGYTGNFSYGTWFKMNGLGSGFKGILTRGNSTKGYSLLLSTNVPYCKVDSLGTLANSAVSAGVWYHAMCVHNGTHMILYVNGVLQNNFTTISSVGQSLTNKLLLGATYNNNPAVFLFNGTIDEVMIFNRSLTALEVQKVYNGTQF